MTAREKAIEAAARGFKAGLIIGWLSGVVGVTLGLLIGVIL